MSRYVSASSTTKSVPLTRRGPDCGSCGEESTGWGRHLPVSACERSCTGRLGRFTLQIGRRTRPLSDCRFVCRCCLRSGARTGPRHAARRRTRTMMLNRSALHALRFRGRVAARRAPPVYRSQTCARRPYACRPSFGLPPDTGNPCAVPLRAAVPGGLGHHPDIGRDRRPAIGVLLLGRLVAHRGQGRMITSSPWFQLTGVATCSVAVSWGESMTRSTSSKLRPVLIG